MPCTPEHGGQLQVVGARTSPPARARPRRAAGVRPGRRRNPARARPARAAAWSPARSAPGQSLVEDGGALLVAPPGAVDEGAAEGVERLQPQSLGSPQASDSATARRRHSRPASMAPALTAACPASSCAAAAARPDAADRTTPTRSPSAAARTAGDGAVPSSASNSATQRATWSRAAARSPDAARERTQEGLVVLVERVQGHQPARRCPRPDRTGRTRGGATPPRAAAPRRRWPAGGARRAARSRSRGSRRRSCPRAARP